MNLFDQALTDFYLRVILIGVTFWVLLGVRPSLRVQLLIVGALTLHSSFAITLRTAWHGSRQDLLLNYGLLITGAALFLLLWLVPVLVCANRWWRGLAGIGQESFKGAYRPLVMSLFTLAVVAVEIVLPFAVAIYFSY